MKLHWSPTSPFVRKVMIAAHEVGAADQLELAETFPQSVIEDVSQDNPLGMIPALVTDEGEALYDSSVIIAWLNHRYGGSLLPAPGPEAWAVYRRHALGHGLIDTTNARFHEHRRPTELQWSQQDAKLTKRIALAVDGLDREAEALAGPFTVAQIAAGVALSYLDLRFPDEDWRTSRPALADWHAAISERPSFAATAPPSS